MRLLLATNNLGFGGSESYLLTVAEQLDRLGHEATVFAPEAGEGVGAAIERGIRVVVNVANLPREIDAAITQDAAVSLQLADRISMVPQLFVAHSEIFDLQTPPQLPGFVGRVVVLNDRVEARMRSLAVDIEVTRLRQPIDPEHFAARREASVEPRKALLLSNTPIADRLRPLEAACAEAGLELARVGGAAGRTADPRTAILDADLVIGYGRSILEAMSCGRAAYVYDWHGGDGWVTAETYPAIEADGFGGRSGRRILDARALSDDLAAYDPSMGPVNHDLVMAHHRANVHAQQLVELIRQLSPPQGRPQGQLEEMARLVRLEWRARAEVHALSRENVELTKVIGDIREDAELRRQQLEGTIRHEYESSRSWRMTRPMRRAGARLRRLLRGAAG